MWHWITKVNEFDGPDDIRDRVNEVIEVINNDLDREIDELKERIAWLERNA